MLAFVDFLLFMIVRSSQFLFCYFYPVNSILKSRRDCSHGCVKHEAVGWESMVVASQGVLSSLPPAVDAFVYSPPLELGGTCDLHVTNRIKGMGCHSHDPYLIRTLLAGLPFLKQPSCQRPAAHSIQGMREF